MAARRIPLLLSRLFSSATLFSRGKNSRLGRGAFSYGTVAAIEETITPPVKVEHTQLLINGQFVDAASGKPLTTVDPRTEEVIAYVAEADAEDVARKASTGVLCVCSG